MKFDDLLTHHIGEFGRYQMILVFLMSIENFFICFHIMWPVFISGVPDHWCRTPGDDVTNCTLEQNREIWIPKIENSGRIQHSQCSVYSGNFSYNLKCEENISEIAGNISSSCDEWNYDTSLYASTIVTEWDLVCDQSWMVPIVSSVFMVGMAIGSLIFGFVADRFGRKKVVLLAGVANASSAVACALSPNFVFFIVMRFLHSFFAKGKTDTVFVMLAEFIGPSKRVFVAVVYMTYWAFGYVLFAGLAYLCRDWRTLALVTSAPEFIYYIGVFFFVAESPRWQLVRNKTKEAEKTLRKMAAVNRKPYPEKASIAKKKKVPTATLR